MTQSTAPALDSTTNPTAGESTPWTPAAEAPPAASASPWDSPAAAAQQAPAPEAAADPWAASTAPSDAGNTDWLNAPASATPGDAAAGFDPTAGGFQLHQLWDGSLPVESWINHGLSWVVTHFRPFFQTVRAPIDGTLAWVEGLLTSVPTLAMIALIGVLAWQFAGRALAVGTVVSLLLVAMLGIWPEAMVTLSLVLTSLAFCLVIGLPLGILLASSDRAQRVMRPVLDAMQTTPAFVYLVPVVMLFGIGNVPGVVVTIVFALPPLVRLTNLGIRQVRPDLIEAARAYGASPLQLLAKVQLPLAMPSIMAGINQSLMLSLSMVVIASMIAVGGLGQMVLRGIGRLDMGLATVGGLGIVLLAITLDRITQSMGQPRRGVRHWWQTGPAGLVWRLAARRDNAAPAAPAADAATPQPATQGASGAAPQWATAGR
ncbi:glycine betaine/L-proline ABC transporter permease ProW [Acidovorax sp. SUPP2522]|uniref:glycine betaine/L-proline ABC transporter permease ProW n=1 Tax=unclassified Acidovorax TaxID=2684926 RepID=UPI00234AAD3D|nr:MULTISPECIES: glycine betaine/L-proline ABC transporter permease ProW [unclassified Acidovorax]WCM96025.1 glycine betaine/L-proline ABC transporter permease ProW [Acidovorax sp. GBBC 1281]GKT18743.1 glycine betaine/L-proline ABC transporter permease ProW [Acidovorax sp. SUPP2522]